MGRQLMGAWVRAWGQLRRDKRRDGSWDRGGWAFITITIHHFVKMALPDRVMEIADPRLLLEEVEATQFNRSSRINFKNRMHDCLSSMARIGVMCSAESPRERMKMNEVIAQMHVVRDSYSYIGVPQQRQALTEMSDEGSSYLRNY